jgi:hypothetical protein
MGVGLGILGLVYKGQALKEEGHLLNSEFELTLTTTVLTLS